MTGYTGVYRLLALVLPLSLFCVLMSVHAVRRLGLPHPASHRPGHLVPALHRHR